MQQPQTMNHLTTDVLPTALYHLRAVGCDNIGPFTLALTAWQGEPVESLETASERQQFQGLHLAACSLLGVERHAPDLRPLEQRDDDSIRSLGEHTAGPARRTTAMRGSFLPIAIHVCNSPHGRTYLEEEVKMSGMKSEIRRLVVESFLRNPKIIAFYDGSQVRYIAKDRATPAHLRAAMKLQKDLMAQIESGRAATLSEAVTALESIG